MTFNSRFGTLARNADSKILVSLNGWVSSLNPTYFTFSLTINAHSGYYGASNLTPPPSNRMCGAILFFQTMVQQLNNQISSLKNPWIQSLVRLQRASERREQGRFLLEGSNLVQAAIEAAWPLECLLVTDQWSSSNRQQFAQWGQQVPVQEVTPQVLKAVATTQTPEGIVAVANIVEQSEELKLPKLGIALDACKTLETLAPWYEPRRPVVLTAFI